MTVAHLNRWYDGLPEAWRFQVVLLPLLLLGAINMALTVSMHFPFGLLVVLAVLVLAIIRVPYLLGWVERAPVADAPAHPGISTASVPWVYDLNLWYEGLPETRQPWVFAVVLIVAGGLNMLLTIHAGFPFGLLFLLALLAIVAIRAPYEAGWLIPPAAVPAGIAVASMPEQIAQDPTPPIAPPVAPPMPPMTIAVAEPAPAMHEPAPSMHEPAPVIHDPAPEPDKPA